MCCRLSANKLSKSRTHHAYVNAAASVDDDHQMLPHLAAAQRGMRRFLLTASVPCFLAHDVFRIGHILPAAKGGGR